MTTIITVVHVIVCFFLVVIVLLQHGKGADMGATFGGSSQTVFGTEGPMPLLNKVTTAAAVIFMVSSISLAYLSAHKSTKSVMQDIPVQKSQENAIEKPADELPVPDTTQPMPLELPKADDLQTLHPSTTAPAEEEGGKVEQQSSVQDTVETNIGDNEVNTGKVVVD